MIKLVAGYEMSAEALRKWCDSKMPASEDRLIQIDVVAYMMEHPDGLPFHDFKFTLISWPPAYLRLDYGKIRNPATQNHHIFITRHLVDNAFPRGSTWNGEYQAEENDKDRLLKETLVNLLDLPESELKFVTYPKGERYFSQATQWEQITILRPQAPRLLRPTLLVIDRYAERCPVIVLLSRGYDGAK